MGIANTGSYNTGSTNTGSFNDGDFNTGFYNTGDYNTGFYNTGDVNTGAFIGGNFSNGAFWQSDHQGQWGAHYAITVPQIPLLNFSLNIPVNIPIHLDFGTLAVNGFQIPAITLRALGVTHFSVGPIIVPRIAGTLPVIDINIGDPGGSSSIPITITSGAGPVVIPLLDIPPAPGFGNSTTGPSSGFFNSGTGSSSGFGNVGANNSGFWNTAFAGIGNSGLQNFGSLQSGWANLGNTVSGFYNTSAADFATPANLSGLSNVGAT